LKKFPSYLPTWAADFGGAVNSPGLGRSCPTIAALIVPLALALILPDDHGAHHHHHGRSCPTIAALITVPTTTTTGDLVIGDDRGHHDHHHHGRSPPRSRP